MLGIYIDGVSEWMILVMLVACVAGLWAFFRLTKYKDTGVSMRLEWIVAISSLIAGMVSAVFGGLMLFFIVCGLFIIIGILMFAFV